MCIVTKTMYVYYILNIMKISILPTKIFRDSRDIIDETDSHPRI